MPYHAYSTARSVFTPAFLAGPIFLLSAPFAQIISSPGTAVAVPLSSWEWILGGLFLIALSSLFGAMVAFIPITIGISMMQSLSGWFDEAATPLAWTVMGAAFPSVAILMISGQSVLTSATGLMFILTGAVSACLCHLSGSDA